MKILIGCEESAKVRDAFLKLGHDAYSCDILPTRGSKDRHIQGDLLDILDNGWDLLIAHPECTYLANSGVCWLHKDPQRWPKLFDAASFFKKLLDAPIKKIAVENPVMHKYGKQLIGGKKQSQVIQPWMFGHTEQKATCLWLKNLPILQPTNDVKEEMMSLPNNQRQRLHYLPPGKNRKRERSETFSGIAEAMATQWGKKS